METQQVMDSLERTVIADPNELDSQPIPLIPILPSTTAEQYLASLPKTDHAVTNMTPAEYLKNLQQNDPFSTSDDDENDLDDDDQPEDTVVKYTPYRDLRTGLSYDPRMRFHVEILTPDYDHDLHPEDPRRISAIYRRLCEHGLVENPSYPLLPGIRPVARPLERIPARYATREECCRIHSDEHFDFLHSTRNATDAELLALTQRSALSIYFNQSTYSCALLAAGSAIDTTIAVVKGNIKNGIAVIRPPGHHAEAETSMGFCHFDNVAVAVRSAQNKFPEIKKVLIIDWDVHHGNGIQNAFYDDPNVLYISLHVHQHGRFYPGTPSGSIDWDGEGPGKGKNINIAWEDQGRNDGDYLMAFQHIIMPVAREFDPDLVIVASGFDAAYGDDLGRCFVTPPCYAQMTHMLMSLADGKVVVCLEGGYNLEAISNSALAVTQTLMGQPAPRISNAVPTIAGARTVFDVIRHHQQHWKSLVPKDESAKFDAIADATRIHDMVRSMQAEQLFKKYRMFQLPIFRDSTTSAICKSFENQVLATPKFRDAEELLLIFHEQPQLAAGADPVSGKISLSTPKILDLVPPFIEWAVKKRYGVIDINLPDFYTGLSFDRPFDDKSEAFVRGSNKAVLRNQLQIVSAYIWDKYVRNASAKRVVMLGIGSGYAAIPRIIATHPEDSFTLQPVRALGVIEDVVPGTQSDTLLSHFDHWYSEWTKIWVPKTNPIFTESKTGRPKKKYGTCIPSSAKTLYNLIEMHKADIKAEINKHFDRSPDPSPRSESVEDVDVGLDVTGSDSSERSILGKRVRIEDGSNGEKSTRARLSEER